MLDRDAESKSAFSYSLTDRTMDTIETKLTAALEGIVAKDAELTEVRASFEKHIADNSELTAKVGELEKALVAAGAEKTELVAKLELLASAQVEASEEAAKIAASVGVPAVESAPEVAPKGNILEQYLALSGADRSAFFAANKSAIVAAMRG